jgi:hypothetical protein
VARLRIKFPARIFFLGTSLLTVISRWKGRGKIIVPQCSPENNCKKRGSQLKYSFGIQTSNSHIQRNLWEPYFLRTIFFFIF